MSERGGGVRLGLLLAAGRGRRLGGTKQLLAVATPTGLKPLVAASFDAIAPACASMVVVLGHEQERIAAALGPREYAGVRADPDAPMFESVRAGLSRCRELAPGAPVLLHPADHPFVARGTLDAVLGAGWGEQAVAPRFQGKGGHPVLIPPGVRDTVLAFDGEGGLRRFWAERPGVRVFVDVSDPCVTLDLDTPEDYERVKQGPGAAPAHDPA